MYSTAQFKKLLLEFYPELTTPGRQYSFISRVTGKPVASVRSQLANGKDLPDWLQLAAHIMQNPRVVKKEVAA